MRRTARVCVRRGDLRGSVGTGHAVGRTGRRRRHDYLQPVGLQRDHRQGRLPPPAGQGQVGFTGGGLRLRRRRRRRIHYRPSVRRPQPDSRKWRAARRKPAVQKRPDHIRNRRQPPHVRAPAHASGRKRAGLLHDHVQHAPSDHAADPPDTCAAVRAGRRGRAGRALRGDTEHAGRRPCKAHRTRPRTYRSRGHIGRTGFEPGADSGGARDGRAGPAAQRRDSDNHAVLWHDGAHQVQRRAVDRADRRTASAHRHNRVSAPALQGHRPERDPSWT